MNVGLPEVIVIVIVILVVFGPSKVPELGRANGRGMREFRKAMQDLEDTLEAEASPPETPVTPSQEAAAPQPDHDKPA